MLYYICTLQAPIPGGGGFQAATGYGEFRPSPGQRRADVVRQIVDKVRADVGFPSQVNILFFSLEPAELPG